MTDPTALPSMGPGNPVRSRALDALLDAGFEPTIDSDGDLAVVASDQKLFIRCVDSAPPMMRVFGQWLLDESLPGDELVRLRAANAVTGALNLVKVTVHENRLAVMVDLIYSESLPLEALLVSTIDAVLGSVRTWHTTVTELLGGEAG